MGRIAVLIFGVFCCSTAVIFIKSSAWPPVMLAGLRLLLAALCLSPIFLRDLRQHRATYTSAVARASLLPGFALAVHFATWIIGCRLTPAANATLIANLQPMVMPFFLLLMIREIPTSRELGATGIALLGLFLLGYEDLNLSPQFFRGDLLCFASMLFLTWYLAIGRKHRSLPSIWLYLIPLYAFAGLLCLCASAVLEDWSTLAPDLHEYLMLAGLVILPTVVGHSILNASMRRMRGQVVSVFNLGQFVFAGIMAVPLYNEIPTAGFYVAAVLLTVAACLLLPRRRALPDDVLPCTR